MTAATPYRPTHLRAWRLHRGLTLETLAHRVGVTHATLSRIERGALPYSQTILEKAAEALGCQPADLLARTPEQQEGLWAVWQDCTPEQRKRVAAIAKIVVGERA